MPRVLVTGYGGFLGSEITRQLLDAGFAVRGVARNAYPELEKLGVEAVQGDITCRDLALNLTRGCDAIVHTAAKAGVWGPWREYYRVNTLATAHLLESAHHNAVRAFVQTSSPSVTFAGRHQSGVDESVPYPKQWLCYYPRTKALAEEAVLRAAHVGKVATCALRPHLIWGLGDPHLFPRVVERTLAGKMRRVGAGSNLIDVVHVRNAARAHLLALTRLLEGDQDLNGQPLFITDGRPVECWSWICRILDCAGVAIPQRSISYAMAYTAGAVLESAYRILRRNAEPPMTRFVAAQLALDHYFKIDRAREFIGYQPQVDWDHEFLQCQPWLEGLVQRFTGKR